MLASASASEVFGLIPPARLEIMSDVLRLVHPEDLDFFKLLHPCPRRNDKGWNIEFRIIRADNGQVAWLEERAEAYPDSRTGEIQIHGVVWDITNRKHSEKALRRSQQQLERVLIETERARREAEAGDHAKDQFLATVSHELRTPLTPVLAAAETLLRRKDLSPRIADCLKLICRNVELETRFIDELLDATRARRGKLELARDPVDIHDAIRRAVEVSEPDATERQQQIILHLAASHSCTAGDFTRLQQVFWNLLKNGAKFTPPRGQIQVASRNERPGWITIDITDTGRGIDPPKCAEIFEAFHQEDAYTTRAFGGLGLGLTIAKAIVEGHGGTILASSPGRDQGSTFTINLPLLNTPPPYS